MENGTTGILADHYTETEVLTALGNPSKRTWDRWMIKGDGPPFVRIGRKRYYRKEAVAKWLRDREQSPRPPRRVAR